MSNDRVANDRGTNEAVTHDRVAVIGGGPSGIITAARFADRGIAVEVFEREAGIGGTWRFGTDSSQLYESTHLITSVTRTQFSDKPFPPGTADFPRHDVALQYLEEYVDEHDLRAKIRVNAEVAKVSRSSTAGGAPWTVTLADGTQHDYAALVIANGHNNRPRQVSWPNDGSVEVRHVATYKSQNEFAGKRVLVVGGGNSGCDIVCDAAVSARSAHLSLRRGYHFFPKVVAGRPVDVVAELPHTLRMPLPLRRMMGKALLRSQIGRYEDYGLPTPDHQMYQSHLTLNSKLFYHLKHGDVAVHPDVRQVRDGGVEFVDGSWIPVDLVLQATGYEWDMPFLDNEIGVRDPATGHCQMLLHVAHPQDPTLFLIGLVQTDSSIWPIAELQARLAAGLLVASRRRPQALDWFRRTAPSRLPQGAFLKSPRHALEVEHASYIRALRRTVSDLDRKISRGATW